MTRWIIASNRLPFSYDEKSKKLNQSSGGLVTALKGIKTKHEFHWVGTVDEKIPKKLIENYPDKKTYSYPTISKDLYDSYYNNFCNDVLWPLCHYESELVRFDTTHWESYVKVNEIFAKHIANIYKKGDVVWVHDFHLFLLPKMLKQINKNIKVGFFLHIPFPSSEVYKTLPVRKEILDGVSYADLIGFHDFSYLRHFASSLYNILGLKFNLMEFQGPLNKVRLGVFQVSIDTPDFIKKAQSNKTTKMIAKFGLHQKKYKMILGVDRLDYSKGLLFKLQIFKKYLEDNPKEVGKVELYQIAVPSRTEVEEYIQLRHEVERLVSEINGQFSRLDYVPVRYFFKSISSTELMALYRSSEVLLVTSKRDGMNLVCLEYISAQAKENPGVVMLSELTGAASSLSHATLINPYNIAESAKILNDCLTMPLKERMFRHQIMLDYLKNYTASVWAGSFMDQLMKDRDKEVHKKVNLASSSAKSELKKELKTKQKVFLIDYDGTLSPIVSKPEMAKISKEAKEVLKELSKKHKVIIVTGRDKKFISAQVKGLPVSIACEHGASFFDFQTKKWRSLVSSNPKRWMEHARMIFKQYQDRTPNSMIEKKTYGIAWHYRNAPKGFGEFQARKLVLDLESDLSHHPVTVARGKMVVEVKSLEASKGYFADWFLPRYTEDSDEIIAIGDDKTDEDMFRSLINRGKTIKVGDPEGSYAHYYVPEQGMVLKLLKSLA